MLTRDQRRFLLNLARETIAAVLDGRKADPPDEGLDEIMRRPAGCFVTLRTHGGDLRGCIGSIHPVSPLYQSVVSSAISAAFRDPRFFPLRRPELDEVEIEISVMGPIVPVKSIDEIEVGRDGLIVTRQHHAGLLLPQVATENGWDRETFLSHTCIKAGLAAAAWRSQGCAIERFSAEVFGERNC
jgi:AmmeMemoRadiSam system protein A